MQLFLPATFVTQVFYTCVVIAVIAKHMWNSTTLLVNKERQLSRAALRVRPYSTLFQRMHFIHDIEETV